MPRVLRRFLILLMAFMAGATMTSCTPANEPVYPEPVRGIIAEGPVATDADLEHSETAKSIRQNGLRIAASNNTPLLSQQNPISGLYEGFDATLANLLGYYLGAPKIDFINTDTRTRETMVKEGVVHVLFNTYSITEKRAEILTFAGPYLSTGQGFTVLKKRQDINSINDFAGKRIIVSANSTGEKLVKELLVPRFPDIKIVPFSNATEGMQALERGDADLAVNDRWILLSQAQHNQQIRVLDERIGDDFYGIGIKHCDVAFRDVINRFLQKIYDSGLWLKVWKETLGTAEPPDSPVRQTGPVWPGIATVKWSRDEDITKLCPPNPALVP